MNFKAIASSLALIAITFMVTPGFSTAHWNPNHLTQTTKTQQRSRVPPNPSARPTDTNQRRIVSTGNLKPNLLNALHPTDTARPTDTNQRRIVSTGDLKPNLLNALHPTDTVPGAMRPNHFASPPTDTQRNHFYPSNDNPNARAPNRFAFPPTDTRRQNPPSFPFPAKPMQGLPAHGRANTLIFTNSPNFNNRQQQGSFNPPSPQLKFQAGMNFDQSSYLIKHATTPEKADAAGLGYNPVTGAVVPTINPNWRFQ